MIRIPRNKGFTLLEVLVALAVIGLVLPPLLLNAAERLHGLKAMEDRMLAAQVARSQLSLIRLASRLNGDRPARSKTGSETMDGREWHWGATSETTEIPGYFRIEVSVNTERSLEEPLTKVVAFFGVEGEGEVVP